MSSSKNNVILNRAFTESFISCKKSVIQLKKLFPPRNHLPLKLVFAQKALKLTQCGAVWSGAVADIFLLVLNLSKSIVFKKHTLIPPYTVLQVFWNIEDRF